MRKGSLVAIAAFCAAVFLPAVAAAQKAYIAGPGYTNMRSGPGMGYPVVVRLTPGTPVNIAGCLATRDWCKAGVQGTRGWLHNSRLEFVYGGRRVLVPNYYSHFAPPVIQFRFD